MPKSTATATAAADNANSNPNSGIAIANLKEVAQQIGKSEQRVRTLVNDGVETASGDTFKLDYDLFEVPGTSVRLRIIKAESVAAYLEAVANGSIGARRGSDRVAFIAWLPKDQAAQQSILDLLAANGVEYRVRNSKASDTEDTEAE